MNDIENPPIREEIQSVIDENVTFIEHENIDDKYALKMENDLQKIRNEFHKTIQTNPNPFPYDNSDSPLTISYNNSDDEDMVSSSSSTSIGKFALGIIASMIGGVSASAEFAVIQQGKKIEEINANCFAKNITCPPKLIESFNTFGSR